MAKTLNQPRQSAGGNGSPTEETDAKDAEALLREDHRKVEALFRQFEGDSVDAARQKELVRQVCNDLVAHSILEEELFYPACREKGVEDGILDEAQVEHDTLKLLIADLRRGEPGSRYFDAKVTVLSEYVKHHVKEEEKALTGIFAKARKGGVDMDELGRRMQERRQQLMTKAGSGEIEMPEPRSLQSAHAASNRNRQETNMAREFDRNRDEERGFGPESGRGRYSGRYTREQDEQTGGRQYGGYSRNEGMGGSRDWYEPERSRNRDYSTGGQYRNDEYTGSGRGYGGYGGFGDYRGRGGSGGGSRDYYGEGGSSRGRFGGGGGYWGNDDDYRGGGGRSGGYGSFERENDDYRRGMGNQDRGRMSGGRSGRDDDYTDLGRRSRFGGRGSQGGGYQADDDDFDYMSGSGRSGGWRNRE